VHYNLGTVLSEQRKIKEAIDELREAIRLRPDFAQALEYLAITLDEEGMRKEARVYWERASKVEKGSEWVTRIKPRLAEPD
jgi:Flp pilus assembly protein TadD